MARGKKQLGGGGSAIAIAHKKSIAYIVVLIVCLLASSGLIRECFDVVSLVSTETIVGTFRSRAFGLGFEAGRGIGSFDRCAALALHEKGRWKHIYYGPYEETKGSRIAGGTNATMGKIMGIGRYVPREVEWLQGSTISWKIGCKTFGRELDGLMYTSPIGNQCGCGVTRFRPSHSEWIVPPGNGTGGNVVETQPAVPRQNLSAMKLYHAQSPAAGTPETRQPGDPADHSPTFRLVKRLANANKTLCFAGDSIDKQFYYALRNNLFRVQRLREQNDDRPMPRPGANASMSIDIKSNEIPVAYTNATSGPVDYSKFWMCMKEIYESVVTLRHGDGREDIARIRYYKMYGWGPWVTFFMDECDVLIMNLALHYQARGNMIGSHYGPNRLEDDFRAAVTYLAGFASSRTPRGGRTAVWRSALPQHFHGSMIDDGHYEKARNCSLVPRRPADGGPIQNYNRAFNQGFGRLCRPPGHIASCEKYELTCTANATSTSSRTVYRHMIENGLVERAEEFRKEYGGNVTGKILRWNVDDLFDVPLWHSSDGDCSHFCYIPPLYERAFERLNLLLPQFE